MGLLSYIYNLTNGTTADASQVQSNFAAVAAVLNGNVDATNISAGSLTGSLLASNTVTNLADKLATDQGEKLGLSASAVTRRGASIIDTTEGYTSSASYGVMATPDRVSNIVLPSPGVMYILFRAEVSATNGASGVKIYLGSNALKTRTNAADASIDPWDGSSSNFKTIFTDPSDSTGFADSSTVNTPATTGQIIGGAPLCVFAAAGTYTVEVRYINNSGGAPGVQARYRKLYVWVQGF